MQRSIFSNAIFSIFCVELYLLLPNTFSRKTWERFCGRNFCKIYFCNLRPFFASYEKLYNFQIKYTKTWYNSQKFVPQIFVLQTVFPLRYVIFTSNLLARFWMGLFGATNGGGGDQKGPLSKICHTYATTIKLGTVIPSLKKI